MGEPAVVSRAEWRWVVRWTLVVLLLSSVPYLVGWAVAAGSGAIFGGFVIGVEDGNSYLAKMGQGARGHWLFHIMYTSEPHDGALFFLFHILLGKLAALLPGPAAALPLRMIWVYHAARLVCSAGLLAVVYRFAAEFLSEVGLRRLGWLLVALGGGLGWLLLALGLGDWLGSPPLDMILPEGFTFLVLFSLPHIALARALLLTGVLAWLRAVRTGMARWAVAAGLSWLGMALIVPFYPAVAATVVGATLLAWWVAERRLPTRELALSALSGLLVVPVVAYTAWVFLTNPVMRGWSAQNLILSPPVLHYLAAYGLPAIMASLGLVCVWRHKPGRRRDWLLVAWALAVPPLLYAPFNLQRRLIEGYQLPLYILAVLGAGRVVWPWLQSHQVSIRPRLLAAALLVAITPTSLLLVAGSAGAALAGGQPIYHTPAEVAAAAWLTGNAEEGALVLSGYPAGNFMPGWAPVRSYYGHGPETIDFQAKRANVERFFDTDTDDGWRRVFLADNGVRFLLHSPAERESGSYAPAGSGFLQVVFQRDGWTVYEFVP